MVSCADADKHIIANKYNFMHDYRESDTLKCKIKLLKNQRVFSYLKKKVEVIKVILYDKNKGILIDWNDTLYLKRNKYLNEENNINNYWVFDEDELWAANVFIDENEGLLLVKTENSYIKYFSSDCDSTIINKLLKINVEEPAPPARPSMNN